MLFRGYAAGAHRKQEKDMKFGYRIISAISAFALIIILLITAVDIAAYSDYGYYEEEYNRLGVLNNIPMEMDDLMDVTKEMMSYLRGNREDLVVITNIDGAQAEFFNDQEKFHMAECRNLFLGGIMIRRICLAVFAAGLAVLLLAGRKEKKKPSLITRTFPSSFILCTVLFLLATGILTALISSDFTRAFTRFHHIFFDNDLWLFDPATSLMINMLPEQFWVDRAIQIVNWFIGLCVLALGLCIVWRKIGRQSAGMFPARAAAFITAAILILSPAVPAKANTYASPLTDYSSLSSWPEAPEIESGAAFLMEAKTGAVLYAKDPDGKHYPASITKLMTALLVLENCNLDDTVTFSYRATHELEEGSTHIARTEGEELSVRDCLYALLLASANEVAQALAEHVSGSIEDFVALMNERAVQLGCQNTHFMNPSGLNNSSHVVSAKDMAIIMRACIQNPAFMEIETATTYTIPATNKNEEPLVIAQKHKLVKDGGEHYSGANGGKTGYTSLAGNTLVTSAERDGMQLICVVMKSIGTHYPDTIALLDYGFNNYKMIHPAEAGTVEYTDADGNTAALSEDSFIPEDEWLLLPASMDISDLTASFSEEVTDGDAKAAGELKYYAGDTEIGTVKVMGEAPEESTTAAADETEESEEETGVFPGAGIGGIEGLKTGVKKQLKKISQPDPEKVDSAVKTVKDYWFFILGGAIIILLIILIIILSIKDRSYRKRRNYSYGGSTSTRRSRKKKGNKYTMRLK